MSSARKAKEPRIVRAGADGERLEIYEPQGARADDLAVLFRIFGVKRAFLDPDDPEGRWAQYIPSGKPWRTHAIEARSVPAFHTSAGADYTVLRHVRETWNYDGLLAFNYEGLKDLQMERSREREERSPINWDDCAMHYEPGDYSRAALRVFSEAYLAPDPPPPTREEMDESLRETREHFARQQAEQQAAEAAADDGTVHERWIVEWDDPRGRGVDVQPLVFTGTRTEALARAREENWWPQGVSVFTEAEWFEQRDSGGEG
jgi:hypothetical protein